MSENPIFTVTLTWAQVDLAAQVGTKRYIRALAAGRTESTGRDERIGGWEAHILGALGEAAAAKIMGLFWEASTDPDYAGDIVPRVHIRTTERDNGCLILHPRDADDGAFYLVTGRPPVFTLRGFIHAADGKNRERYWREDVPLPAFFIPQSDLKSPEKGSP